MTGWIYIILTASASVLVAHFLKVSESKKLNTVRVLTVNYFIAALTAFATAGSLSFPVMDDPGSIPATALAVATGIIFIANFFIYSKSVFHNGVGISVAAMRISLIIPVLLSTLWYLEFLSFMQWVGVMLVFASLLLLLPNKRKLLREPLSAGWLLVLLFIGTGLGDSALKIYESEFSGIWVKQQFMGMVFLTSFLAGLIFLIIRKNFAFTRYDLLIGAAIGIPNLYTTIFLIDALEHMNGAVVYSGVNVLTVLGATVLGIMRWGDRLKPLQWAGIFFTLVSILLLI